MGPGSANHDSAGAAGRRTRSPRVWAVAVICLLAVVATVAAVVAARTLGAERRAQAKLADASDLIERADKVVVEIDGVVSAEMTSALVARAESAAGRIAGTRSQLEEALTLLGEASRDVSAKSRKRAELLGTAARARLEMLEHAPVILDANVKAAKALPGAEVAWREVLAADKKSDSAVAQYNKLTKAGVRASSRLNRQAASQLSRAREGLLEAERLLPEADFESFIAYVDIRIKLNASSQQSDAAWLAGDLAKANARIAEYNKVDEKGVAMAKTLPVSPAKAVADAYERLAGEATDAYFAARKRATDADTGLKGL